jgi:cell division transport system ATP-binding protein
MSALVVDITNADIYQQNNLILSNVNLKIQKGEFLYLMGKTGFGKSSLLKTLYAELPLKKGTATVCGFDLQNIKSKNIHMLRRKLGMVFQDFQLLWDRTSIENLKFVLMATGWDNNKVIEERCSIVLQMVGLGSKNNKMPHQLSGGEQQRLAIARALLNSPELILADEPTGNLDPETSIEIVELLRSLATDGCAVVMASHDVHVMNKFDARRIRLENGHLME